MVFSRTLADAGWNNTTLVWEDAVGEITRLKEGSGKDLYLFGSAGLASTLVPHRLIDEYRLMVNPVALGQGIPLFQDLHEELALKRTRVRSFQNGNVLLVYEPAAP